MFEISWGVPPGTFSRKQFSTWEELEVWATKEFSLTREQWGKLEQVGELDVGRMWVDRLELWIEEV